MKDMSHRNVRENMAEKVVVEMVPMILGVVSPSFFEGRWGKYWWPPKKRERY
jgi:hypothetical protein